MRAARRVAAAAAAWSAGQADRALAELDAAGPRGGPLERAEAARIRAAVELQRGVPARAHRLLADAAVELAPHDGERALRLGVAAMEAASLAGEPPRLPLPGAVAPDGFLGTFVAASSPSSPAMSRAPRPPCGP